MKFKVSEEGKNKLVFQLEGETHTFCNLLKKELQSLDGVEVAVYKIDHPLVGVPQFLLQTKGIAPREALKKALAQMKKKADKFLAEIKNL